MDVIDLDNIGEEGREEERGGENREKDQDETSFSENTKDNYDNTRSQINSEPATQSETKSEQGQKMLGEEADVNDLTRFERFKKWAKENITGVSAVAISVAGVVTAAVMAGRGAIKKGAKAVGNFGKALANLAKKAGPAIAAILNFVAQAITWGAKALEFLSRNLWLVALFLTYLLYDTVKERVRNKN